MKKTYMTPCTEVLYLNLSEPITLDELFADSHAETDRVTWMGAKSGTFNDDLFGESPMKDYWGGDEEEENNDETDNLW